MNQLAMPISISAKRLLAAIGASALCVVPANAQLVEQEPDVEDVARTPLEDFNVESDDIPQVLIEATQDPYASEGLSTCNEIVAWIAALDQVLGADFDIADDEERGISEGRVAQSVVGSFIPFRGIVREISGANSRQREVNLAIASGMVRRGFLKGLGQGRGCNYPARPRENRGSMSSGK